MIIDFTNVNGGGGGSGYTLPVASQSTLGGVKVGSGLSITSAGTLSADGVDLTNYVQEQELSAYQTTQGMSGYVETTAMSGYQTTEGMSGYVQTTQLATTEQTGLVKIGSGITVDNTGTISVTGGTGGGIEVVTELPASGTDGQMVLLETVTPEKHIHITGMGTNSNPTQSVTAIGITEKTFLFNYNNYSTLCPVYVNPDGSYSIYDPFLEQENIYPVGETTAYTITNAGRDMSVTGVVTTTGCTFTVNPASTWRENAINDIDQHEEEKQELYTWSDSLRLTADIDYSTSSGNPWCVCFRYKKLPENVELVTVRRSPYVNFRHIAFVNGSLNVYQDGNQTLDLENTSYEKTISKYSHGFDVTENIQAYYTDDMLVIYTTGNQTRYYVNENDFLRTGWIYEKDRRVSDKVYYKNFTWYDEDSNILYVTFNMYSVGLKINPSYSSENPYRVFSVNNSNIGPFFAPTTTASTSGQVCVSAQGWAAPTWVSPETITNGVKFWKGTQDQYEAIGEGNYDASTLYIIIP